MFIYIKDSDNTSLVRPRKIFLLLGRVWSCNQNPYIEEEQATQWPKEEEQATQWPKEEEQATQWPKEEEQATQWLKVKGQITMYKTLHIKLKIE